MKKKRIDQKNQNNSNEMNASYVTIKIIIIYMIIGFTWILLSDFVIEFLFDDSEVLRLAQSIKGTFYVAFTAVIFYYIIHRSLIMYVETINDLQSAYSDLDKGHKKSLSLEEKLYDLAFYDALTGLQNKVLLEEKVNQYIVENQHENLLGFVYFDIDEFRNINEVKGHSVGDQLIKEVAHILKDQIQPPNMLARMGGDEFVIALFDVDNLELFLPRIESYFSLIRKSFKLDEDDFFITFSAGIALYPDHGNNYITLLRHADAAMSIAKSKGKDQVVIFDDEMVTLVKQQTELLSQLRQAIGHNEFLLHYQPIIKLSDDSISGVEALIRWVHPVKGFIPPLAFISLSEKNGFIKEITEWVFREAAEKYKDWNTKKKSFKISINLSGAIIMNDKFITNLIQWIDEHDIDCTKFNLEVTETAIITDIEKSIHVLNQLKRLGFTIALDDFGTGYSSLTYLQRLPIDTIKIDRSFISSIKENTDEFYVLKYMIDLAHHLKLIVIAEGIETKEQSEMVKKYKVDYAQGYYYCRPMPLERVVEYIEENQN